MPYDFIASDGRFVVRRALIDTTTQLVLEGGRVSDAIRLTPAIATVDYDGAVSGNGFIDLYYTVEPSQTVVDEIDGYFANSAYVVQNPSNAVQYAGLSTDADRIAYIAALLGLT